jgi:hypothetical protein
MVSLIAKVVWYYYHHLTHGGHRKFPGWCGHWCSDLNHFLPTVVLLSTSFCPIPTSSKCWLVVKLISLSLAPGWTELSSSRTGIWTNMLKRKCNRRKEIWGGGWSMGFFPLDSVKQTSDSNCRQFSVLYRGLILGTLTAAWLALRLKTD